jgi:hypothetical protein
MSTDTNSFILASTSTSFLPIDKIFVNKKEKFINLISIFVQAKNYVFNDHVHTFLVFTTFDTLNSKLLIS